jgi:signal transduction histidine kinase
MLKIFERSITLQLLIFYGLFVLPLLLGGIELYLFQRDALQQSAQRSDLGLAQAIANTVQANLTTASEETLFLASTPAARQLHLPELQSTFASAKTAYPDDRRYLVCTPQGQLLLAYPLNPITTCAANISTLVSTLPAGQALILPGTDKTSLVVPIIDAAHLKALLITQFSLDRLTSQLLSVRQQLTSNSDVRIWVLDHSGMLITGTSDTPPGTPIFRSLPALRGILNGTVDNVVAHASDGDWLCSILPLHYPAWSIVIARPTAVTFAVVTSFQHSLVIALLMLIVGASLFWFVMHGWFVAPLARLAQAVAMIKPDGTRMVTARKTIAKERRRADEIGQLVSAISLMENEIHTLFRKSDKTSQGRLHTLDAIMSSMTEGVLLESPQGRVVYANESFIRFVGFSMQDASLDDSGEFGNNQVTEKFLSLVEDPEAYSDALRRAELADESELQLAEVHVSGFYNKVGQFVPLRRDILVKLFQVRDQAGQLIGRGKIFNDVTRRNEAERVKKNLLAIVSHELRTPLTAIKGYATSLLAPDIELETLLQQRFLHRIVEEGDRMADLVTNLLEMSQLGAGTLRLSPTLCHIRTLLDSVASLYEGKALNIIVPDAIALISVDQRRIEMVLRNLIENALRYAGPAAELEIVVVDEHNHLENGLTVRVTDNGPGLPPHLTERVFEQFYQIEEGRSRSSGGVGLGLAICRGFIEAHGGKIWAENRLDGRTGAVFSFWLPPKVFYQAEWQPGTPFDLQNVL